MKTDCATKSFIARKYKKGHQFEGTSIDCAGSPSPAKKGVDGDDGCSAERQACAIFWYTYEGQLVCGTVRRIEDDDGSETMDWDEANRARSATY